MIKGISVTLISKMPNGKDPFGKVRFSDKEIIVENVLVAPSTSDEVTNALNLTGRKSEYTLAIPKGDTNEWENQEVEFFGHRWKVIGIPLEGIDELIPLQWNKKVMVERYGHN